MHKLVIFGPLPPPNTGMETMTTTLLTTLGRLDPHTELAYRHIDTRVNRSQRERERFRIKKIIALARQFALSVRFAVTGYHAYYPISQNRIGLGRDMVLLIPFRLARRKLFLHLHGSALSQFLGSEPRLIRALAYTVLSGQRTHGIVLTPSLRDQLRPIVPERRTTVVPNTTLTPLEPAPQLGKPRPLRLLFLSTLMRTKGYRELIAAVEHLRSAGHDVRLRLAGEPFTSEDARWVDAHANAEGIEFLGPLEGQAKWQAIDACHVLALPSTAPEGQPLALIEAMARGRCVLTTAQGGIADTVGDESGLVLPPASGPSLERLLEGTLSELIRQPDRVRVMGDAARARFNQHYSPQSFLSRWLAAIGCTT